MKRVISLILAAVMLITSIPITAVAAEENKLKFDINVDGEHVVYVEAGEEITVSFNITNMSEDSDFTITNLQNEIEYDQDFFEFTEGDVEYETAMSSRLAEYSWGAKRVQILALHVSGGTAQPYENGQLVAKVTFKVKDGLADGTSGKLLNKACEAADGVAGISYSISNEGLTVFVGSEKIETCSVSYVDGDKVISVDNSVALDREIDIYGSISKENKKFGGWKAPDGEIYKPGEKYLVEEDTVFEAVWYDKVSICFETNGGNDLKDATVWQNETVDLSEFVTEREGFSFSGWYIDEALSEKVETIVIMEDTTVYAKWIKDNVPEFKLTFQTNGGDNITSVTAEKGTVIDLSDYTPTRSGYTFNGWYSDSELTEKVESIELTEDTTVYAKWTKKSENPGGGGGGGGGSDKIEISFETNGGIVIDSVYVLEKATVDLSKYVPEKEGFKFEGWFADTNFTKPLEKIIAEEDVTVYAKWSAIDDGKNDKENVTDGKENTDKEDGLDGGNNTPAILTDKHFAYIVGRDDGYIRPKANLTRAEAATIFFRLLNDKVRNEALTKENSFNDVNENNWFNTAVSTLAKLGIINGRTPTEFAPAAPITRAELTTIVARMSDAKYEGKNLFDDIDNHWAENYINVAASNKWIEGDGNGLFRPNDNITRAEVMVLINRVLGRLPESKDDLLEGMTEWPDNTDESAWFYIAIQEATNSHDYDYKEDGVHEQWTKLTDNPDWSAFEN